MKTSNKSYILSRKIRDVEVLLTGDPKKITKRVKNKIIGRLLAKIGFWKLLWG